jgi:quinol monooxygenase YgiN
MIYVIATVEVASGKRENFLKELNRVVPSVRAERGCLEYGPHVDVPTDIPVQTPQRKDTVTIIERWTDVQALKAHLTSSHMLEYRKRVRDLVTGMNVQILEKA